LGKVKIKHFTFAKGPKNLQLGFLDNQGYILQLLFVNSYPEGKVYWAGNQDGPGFHLTKGVYK